MKEYAISDPTDCLYFLIYRISLLSTGALKRELKKHGIATIKPAYIGALMSLWHYERLDETVSRLGIKEGIKLSDLGKRAGLEPSSMTGLVDRMERDGLVARIDDPDDRRAQLVVLTKRGREVQGAVTETVNTTLEAMFRDIPAREVERIKSLLKEVLENVKKEDFD